MFLTYRKILIHFSPADLNMFNFNTKHAKLTLCHIGQFINHFCFLYLGQVSPHMQNELIWTLVHDQSEFAYDLLAYYDSCQPCPSDSQTSLLTGSPLGLYYSCPHRNAFRRRAVAKPLSCLLIGLSVFHLSLQSFVIDAASILQVLVFVLDYSIECKPQLPKVLLISLSSVCSLGDTLTESLVICTRVLNEMKTNMFLDFQWRFSLVWQNNFTFVICW